MLDMSTREALTIAIHALMGGAAFTPQNKRDAAAAVLSMIREQQGCKEPFGEADTLPEFIDVIVFG